MVPHFCSTDKSKAMYVAQFIRSKPRDEWCWHRQIHSIYTWVKFKGCLKFALGNPIVRFEKTYRRYTEAKQKDQSVTEFLSYLRSLEEDIPNLAENVKYQTFYNGCKKEIRTAIAAVPISARDRNQLVDQATSIEDALNQPDDND